MTTWIKDSQANLSKAVFSQNKNETSRLTWITPSLTKQWGTTMETSTRI